LREFYAGETSRTGRPVEALVSALVLAVEPPVIYGQVKTSVKIIITACFERVLRGRKKSHRSTVEALVLAVEPPVIYGQVKTSVKKLIAASFERVLRGGKKSHRSTVEALVSALVSAVEPPVTYGQVETSVERNEPRESVREFAPERRHRSPPFYATAATGVRPGQFWPPPCNLSRRSKDSFRDLY
jgi:hypothetical protein